MRSSQLRKTVNRNRNKRKTRRNKRTKNARGGAIAVFTDAEYEMTYDNENETNKILKIFKVSRLVNGMMKPTFDGEMDTEGNGHGKKYRYNPDGSLNSEYDGEIKDNKKNGTGVEIGTVMYKEGNSDTIRTEGVWSKNKAVSGKRSINYKDGTKSVYVGGLDGVMVRQGKGTYTFYDKDGNVLMKPVYAEWDKDKVVKPLQSHEVPQPESTPPPLSTFKPTPTPTPLSRFKPTPTPPLLKPPPTSKFVDKLDKLKEKME